MVGSLLVLYLCSDTAWYMINIVLTEVLTVCALFPLLAITFFLLVSAVISVPLIFSVWIIYSLPYIVFVLLLTAASYSGRWAIKKRIRTAIDKFL